jgi:hypothetical protein
MNFIVHVHHATTEVTILRLLLTMFWFLVVESFILLILITLIFIVSMGNTLHQVDISYDPTASASLLLLYLQN